MQCAAGFESLPHYVLLVKLEGAEEEHRLLTYVYSTHEWRPGQLYSTPDNKLNAVVVTSKVFGFHWVNVSVLTGNCECLPVNRFPVRRGTLPALSAPDPAMPARDPPSGKR